MHYHILSSVLFVVSGIIDIAVNIDTSFNMAARNTPWESVRVRTGRCDGE
jgi:hypothetical protein